MCRIKFTFIETGFSKYCVALCIHMTFTSGGDEEIILNLRLIYNRGISNIDRRSFFSALRVGGIAGPPGAEGPSCRRLRRSGLSPRHHPGEERPGKKIRRPDGGNDLASPEEMPESDSAAAPP